jgi:hypothetical protein
MVFRRIVAHLVGMALVWPMCASAASVYVDNVDASFEKEDKASESNGFFKCELVVGIAKYPTRTSLRVKLLKSVRSILSTVTIDVRKFSMLNDIAIPYSPQIIPIVEAGIVSNIFETTRMKQIDMGDGGIGIALTADALRSLSMMA